MPARPKTATGNKTLQNTTFSVQQLNAIDLLVTGKTDQETADLVGVHRVTVTKWRRYLPAFTAEMNRRREDIWKAGIDQLRMLIPKALTTIGQLLEDAPPELRMKAAIDILKLCPFSPEVCQTGPTREEELIDQEVRRQREDSKRIDSEQYSKPFGSPSFDAHRKQVRKQFAAELNQPITDDQEATTQEPVKS